MDSADGPRSSAARWRLRLIAFGFLLAFAASVATLIFTGLKARGASKGQPAAAHSTALDDASKRRPQPNR